MGTDLVIRYVTGPSDEATVRVKSQTDDAVTFELRISGPGGDKDDSANSVGQLHEETLLLDEPLGTRKVLNPDGSVIARADASTN